MSSRGLEHIFQSKKMQAELFVENWGIIKEQIIESFGKERTSIIDAAEALDEANVKAYEKLVRKLESPTVSIATTGTTSSGKSTVVNMLCGHEIMPVSTGEMSAGVVTIYHHPDKRTLRVLETSNATWECGEWDNLTDDEIRQMLTDVMKKYNEKRETSDEPPCPQIELEFPIRIGLDSDYVGIPKNYKFQVMDLPGFKFSGDEGNMKVIKRCKESLCLVTYNSEETDGKKQDELLNEVINQVKSLGGSPARMLFVLNRIDAFRRDGNWEESEKEFVNKVTAKIKEKLSEALPEYEEDINNVRVIKLSSLPAYLSLIIKHGNKEYQQTPAKRIDKFFSYLIPDDIYNELPKRVEKWSEQDMNRVSDSVWDTSYGKDFQENLKQHIENHLPELVIPQIIDGFKKEITIPEADNQNCVVWGIQTINAEMNSSKEKYEAECRNLEKIEQKLDEQRKKNTQMLLEPFDRIAEIVKKASSNKNWNIEVREVLKKISYKNLPANSLDPLFTWVDILAQTAGDFFQEIAQALDSGRPIVGKIFDSLPSQERASLSPICHELTNLEYHKKQGKHIETRDAGEKEQLRLLNEALNKFSNSLANATSKVIKKAAEQEEDRIYNAINKVSKTHLAESWKEAQKIAPKLGFGIPPIIKLDIAESNLNFDYKFKGGFDLKTTTRNDKVGTNKVWAGKKKVRVKEKRVWYTLWICKKDVYEERDQYKYEPVYKQRTYGLADVPDVEDLMDNWVKQLFSNETQVVKEFTGWLTDQIKKLNNMVEKAQQKLLENYKKKLDDAYNSTKRGHEVEMERLSAILENANTLENIFKELPNLKNL